MGVSLAAIAGPVGLVVLVVAADRFVAAAAAVATRRRWSPALIGAVVVGFGTSLPELVTSVLAAGAGDPGLALGNAAGSNVANLLLILGVAALVAPIRGGSGAAPVRDAVLATGASLLLVAVAVGGQVSAVEGALLVLALVGVVAWQVRTGRASPIAQPALDPVASGGGAGGGAATGPAVEAVGTDGADGAVGWRIAGGLLGVLLGAQLLVGAATTLAEAAGVPSLVVGTVLVAVGTSLPELATAIASARRGQVELLLGNLLGSNAFNATVVVGASALVATARGEELTLDLAGLAVVVAAAVVTVGVGALLVWRPRVSRPMGLALVALHLAAVPVLLAIG